MENLSTTKNKIVLIPFPFDTLETTKVRPALCLTDPIGPHRHVIKEGTKDPVKKLPKDEHPETKVQEKEENDESEVISE